MLSKNYYTLFRRLIDTFDQGWRCVEDYNELLHDYNGVLMYQAESQFIHQIGKNPGITVTELANVFHKTRSACSQLMRRMKEKGWLYQKRNIANNREYNLYLTEEGEKIYSYHKAFESSCYERTAQMLSQFSEEELETYIRIQEKMNEAFSLDVEESKQLEANDPKFSSKFSHNTSHEN